VRPASRVLLGLAAFLIVDGTIYIVTAREWTGGPLLVAASVSFAYLGIVLWRLNRRAARSLAEDASAHGAIEVEEVGPTIWPVGFSVSAVLLALGLAISRWVLAVGAVLFVVATIGWFRDIRIQRRHHQRLAPDVSP
jgi:uncharacterized membrane protein